MTRSSQSPLIKGGCRVETPLLIDSQITNSAKFCTGVSLRHYYCLSLQIYIKKRKTLHSGSLPYYHFDNVKITSKSRTYLLTALLVLHDCLKQITTLHSQITKFASYCIAGLRITGFTTVSYITKVLLTYLLCLFDLLFGHHIEI